MSDVTGLTPEQLQAFVEQVKQRIREVMQQRQDQVPPPPVPLDNVALAQVIPFDVSRRRTREQRLDRKKREQKRRVAADRKKHNEKVVRQENLKKD